MLHAKRYVTDYSMLTGLKVFCLICKCAFYRPELNAEQDPMELIFEGLEMKDTNEQSSKNR